MKFTIEKVKTPMNCYFCEDKALHLLVYKKSTNKEHSTGLCDPCFLEKYNACIAGGVSNETGSANTSE